MLFIPDVQLYTLKMGYKAG